MTKVQIVDKAVRTTTAYRRSHFAKPKVLFFGHKATKKLSNLSANNVRRHREETKNARHSKRHPFERYVSVAVHLFAFLLLSVMILMETSSYWKNPTGTTVEDDMYPVQKIDFPGIAICNINVISRQEANTLAEELWQLEDIRDIGNLTLETIKSLIHYMGHLYKFESSEQKEGEIMLLHEILTKASTKDYHVLRIMERLAPKCRTLLKACYWQGEYRSCQELFIPRWTQDGYCCTFNYVRWTDGSNGERNEYLKIDVLRSTMAGVEYGLWMFLEPHLDDYYYNILAASGFKLLVYTASDYPDAPSGGLREIFIRPGSEAFLGLNPTSFYSSPDVIQYDKKKRHCLFNTELSEIFDGFYSYSQCMMFCRTRDIIAVCNCIPFFYPVPNDIGKVRACNLVDLACLERNRLKWWTVEPTDYEFTYDQYSPDKDQGKDAHLKCDCLPSCENVDYTVSVTSSKVIRQGTAGVQEGCQNISFSNDNAAVSVSFGSSTGAVRLRQDVLFHWYDLLSSYGGLCSLFLGISIMTPIEFIYLLYLRIFDRERGNENLPQTPHSPAAVKLKLEDRTIYWNEITLAK